MINLSNVNLGDRYLLVENEIEAKTILETKQIADSDLKLPNNQKKICSIHLKKRIKCNVNSCKLTICQDCMFEDKEELTHFIQHHTEENITEVENSQKSYTNYTKEKENEKERIELRWENDALKKINSYVENTLQSFDEKISKIINKYSKLGDFNNHQKQALTYNLRFSYFIYSQFIGDIEKEAKRILSNAQINDEDKLISLNNCKTRFKSIIGQFQNDSFNRFLLTRNYKALGCLMVGPNSNIDPNFYDAKYLDYKSSIDNNLTELETSLANFYDISYNDPESGNIKRVKLRKINTARASISKIKEKKEEFSVEPYICLKKISIPNDYKILLIKIEILKVDTIFINFFWRYFFGIEYEPKDTFSSKIEIPQNQYRMTKTYLNESKRHKKEKILNEILFSEKPKGVFFQSNGFVSEPFTNNGDYMKILNRSIVEGDCIYFYIDTSDHLYIGINDTNKDNYTYITRVNNHSSRKIIHLNIFHDSAVFEGDFKVTMYA